MDDYYVLNAVGEPERCGLLTWARWFEAADRHVALDVVNNIRVSTVFLGVNHRFFGQGKPILWESMIFGGRHDGDQRRYASRRAALNGHRAMVNIVKRSLKTTRAITFDDEA